MLVEMVQDTSTKIEISEQNLEVNRNNLDIEVKRPSATRNQATEEIVVKSVNLRAAKEIVGQGYAQFLTKSTIFHLIVISLALQIFLSFVVQYTK